ncbi:GDSL-type esterase/lipase family protein [Sphingomonas sp. KR1UV-12]|uniref:GDSL-type esterase/lipase family protein n=1 Tax=Sphingomonas aurea TaxID=3063994 RepID=A0ABT9EJA0_9SPHN|nr:GDSL-type esterase/lipase family protein [Sphingomonas sp. KR1UV-12]MDP1027004.1 GDSL-type esterase/lipase family protein [Sphingomonas sp. KR1UV-12]
MTRPHPVILAIGDSLVAGYGLTQADSFTAQLERRLRATFPDARVMNAGVSGDTAAGVLKRLPALLSRLPARPSLAIVQVGPNDVLRQVPPSVVRASLEAILLELGRCEIPVLLTTVEPPALLRDRAAAYIGIHQELAALHSAVTAPFFPDGVLGHPAMVLADRMHPNSKAISAVVDALLSTVEKLLDDH